MKIVSGALTAVLSFLFALFWCAYSPECKGTVYETAIAGMLFVAVVGTLVYFFINNKLKMKSSSKKELEKKTRHSTTET